MANKVNVTPLHDRVIVKPAAAEEKTAGGIIIPDTAKEKPQRRIKNFTTDYTDDTDKAGEGTS